MPNPVCKQAALDLPLPGVMLLWRHSGATRCDAFAGLVDRLPRFRPNPGHKNRPACEVRLVAVGGQCRSARRALGLPS